MSFIEVLTKICILKILNTYRFERIPLLPEWLPNSAWKETVHSPMAMPIIINISRQDSAATSFPNEKMKTFFFCQLKS